MGTALSEHFDLEEWACRHCGTTPPVTKGLKQLAQLLEVARARHYPKGLRIVSGYRCPSHNKDVGGKPASRHLSGDAADIMPVMTLQQARDIGFRGIGYQQSTGLVVHVDMRPKRSTWSYDANGKTP